MIKRKWMIICFLALASAALASLASTASAQEPELTEEGSGKLAPEEEQLLNDEFKPPQEAPYNTSVDPITAETVKTPKEEPPATAPAPAPSTQTADDVQSTSPSYLSSPRSSGKPFRQEGLKKITAKGEYLYQVDTSPQKYGFGFRAGTFEPPNLSNNLDNGESIYFSDLYGDSAKIMLMLDFEWQVMRSAGKLGVKAGTGFYSATGHGRFKRDPTLESREVYTFYLFPNSIDAVYRAQFWDRQPIVPYGFGGINYFTFLENRDDHAAPKYGGALASNFGGGVQLLLDALDRQAINQLDKDYGINHIWLDLQYQQIVGMNDEFDFSNSLFTGGIFLEF